MVTPVKIYGIKNCSTMKKAFDWLDLNGVAYSFHDYKKAGLPESDLQLMLEKIPFEVLMNKKGTTWRKLTEEQQLALTPESALQLLPQMTSLLKRPIILANDEFVVGYDESVYAEYFLK